MELKVIGGTLEHEELQAYIDYVSQKEPNQELKTLEIDLSGEYVDLKYQFEVVPVERIRRITGYLVGTLGRFNDAKAAEERDRVRHGMASV